jgi:hypothetical protein
MAPLAHLDERTVSDARGLGKYRALVLRLAALALLAATFFATSAQAQSPVPAQSSRAFGDSVGVNVRLSHLDSSYGDFDTLFARLRELGARTVLDYLCPTCEWQIDRLRRLAQAGIKSTLGVQGGWSGGSAAIANTLAAMRNRLQDSVIAISGVNEPDLSGDPNWIAKTRAYTTELYTRAKADPVLRGLPVIGPSLVYRPSRTALGDLTGVVDRGNLHPYPGGRTPLYNIEDERQMMSAVSGSEPLVITEVGYHTDMAYPYAHRPASERAIGIYTPRIVLEAFRAGVERTHIFQLVDIYSDAEAAQRGFPKSQNSFGLLRWNFTPKPSFIALRNLLRAVDASSAAVGAPGALRYSIAGAGPDVRSLLLRSADGSFRLALWRDVSVWNRDTLQDVDPPRDHVDVTLGEPISQARRYDPNLAPTPTQAWDGPGRIGVDLGGEAVVLELIPPGTAADRRALRAVRGLRAGRALGSCRGKASRATEHKRAPRAARRARKGRAKAVWRVRCVSARRR